MKNLGAAAKRDEPVEAACDHGTTADGLVTDFDVVIVGGGPAGISTWLRLHQKNPELAERTLVLEKAVYPRDKLCGGGVTRAADKELAALDIHLDVPSVPIRHVELRFAGRVHRIDADDAFRVIRRHEFDHALARGAIARGLHLHQDEALKEFTRIDGALRVSTNRAQYKARVLVGADGALSIVRRNLDLAEARRVSNLLEIFTPAGVGNEDPGDDCAIFDFSPVGKGLQGYIWSFPCLEKGKAFRNRGIFNSRVRSHGPERPLIEIFKESLEKEGIDTEGLEWKSHPERWYSPEATFSGDNVILVGDAAGIEPVFGEGISNALQYGDVGSAAIVEAFKRNDFSFETYRSRLLEHPLGQELTFRTRIANEMYKPGPDAVKNLYNLVNIWLLVEQIRS